MSFVELIARGLSIAEIVRLVVGDKAVRNHIVVSANFTSPIVRRRSYGRESGLGDPESP
jgi:hypothetical protein